MILADAIQFASALSFMDIWLIVLICVAAVLFAFLLMLAFAAIADNFAFGKRYDKNPLLKYFTASDFNLASDEFPLARLNGAIYENKSVEPKDEVVIFVHGMGPGHCAYMTEIAYFCNLGYTVIAVDSLGCGESQGKKMRGMYEGVRSAVHTIEFAKAQFSGKKIYLVGHSWGGYSVLCASKLKKVDKVVAISAPSSPSKTVENAAARMLGKPFAAILRPFWWFINVLKFGGKGNLNAAKCAETNDTPTLLIHGDNDSVVANKNEAFCLAEGGRVEKFLAVGKAHNPYNTVEAEKRLAELSDNLSRSDKMTEEERQNYFSNFDFVAATEEDKTVMNEIQRFLTK